MEFSDRQESKSFYDQRYSHGYMGHWSVFEKRRIFDLVKELNLPSRGKALDFGCGRGIFTAVIKEALPGWEVFGCDISSEAIAAASSQNKEIKFFVLGDPELAGLKFDFIHSHHMLEHTYNVQVTAKEIVALAAPVCAMMHSLPCNHPGSLEYIVSSQMKNGINDKTGTFFFEDQAHLRRLSVDQTSALFLHDGFVVYKDYYANQYYGALKWIAESELVLILNFTDSSKAVNPAEPISLFRLRNKLIFFWFCTFAAMAFQAADRGKYFYLKKFLQAFSFILFFWIALPARSWLVRNAVKEWKEERTKKNGTDMFLLLKRG
ncbi:MAG: class I SAM-dependent methyltransferase [Bacteroidetes bacterium]|nr:class I SAM-dependent methyltransferase [Bacteroidota bacterium]